ncbi:LysE family translocator [Streptomyces sp. NPDC001922]|uniref:LysE family translocator n=1 Tax=Streptomyces sp. NPDC001922 TaxID=3364624 RepID=UPI0036C5772A
MLGISWAELGSFTVLCLILAATPGANLTVVLRCARQGGQRAAVAAAAGLTLGKVCWAAGSVLGLATLLATSPTAYNALRLAGAAYLIWLGVQALLPARRHATANGTTPDTNGLSVSSGFRRGLAGDLLNPKVGIFYTTVFPQFIGPHDPAVPAAAVLLTTHTLVLMTWYPTVSHLIIRASRRLRHRPHPATLDRITGTTLIALGIQLTITPP